MGTVFQVPWTRIGTERNWAEEGVPLLNRLGFTVAALALENDSVTLQNEHIAGAKKLALVLGTEGDGLAPSTIANCNYTVKIPMAHQVDSLNGGRCQRCGLLGSPRPVSLSKNGTGSPSP